VAVWLFALELFYWLIRAFPVWWWLPVAGALWLLSVVSEYLLPVIIWRLFYKVRPLEDADLAQRLTALAERAKTRVLGVYVMELSSRTSATNAWLTGLGRTRRIVLPDTMLQHMTPDEIETILAHELAHHVHNDIPKALAVNALVTLATVWLTSVAVGLATYAQGTQATADVANLPAFGLNLIIVEAFRMSVGNYLSRRSERAADLYALRTTGKYEAFRSAMAKLADLNLVEANPSYLRRKLFFTHPATDERMQMVSQFTGGNAPARGTLRLPLWAKLAMGAAALLMVAVVVVGTMTVKALGPRLVTADYGYVPPPPPGPAASWETLLSTAREQVDKEGLATLYELMAYPEMGDGGQLSDNNIMQVTFYFYYPDGTDSIVSMYDSDPPRLARVVPQQDFGMKLSEQEQTRAIEALTALKVGPRELYRKTLSEGLAFGRAQGDQVWPFMTIYLADDQPPKYASGTGWRMTYETDQKQLDLWTDPGNGNVVSREVNDIEPEN
jgi:Zn-dependent protease with chaperone function